VTVGNVTEPDAARHDVYTYYLRKYQATYPKMKELMQEMTGKVAGV